MILIDRVNPDHVSHMFFSSVRRVAPSLGRRFYSPGYRYVRFSTPKSPKTNQYTPFIKLAIGAGAFGSVYYVTQSVAYLPIGAA